MLFNLISSDYHRPSRLEKNKDADYHARFARYCISSSSNDNNHHRIMNTLVNKSFYKGNQWILEEDLESFLMDESGDARNRIKFVHNLIRPMVEQFRGNAIRLDFNVRAQAISQDAINRREQALSEKLVWHDMANNQPITPGLKQMIQDQKGIGTDMAETQQNFERTYVDKFVKAINMILKWAKDVNDIRAMMVRLSEDIALAGIGVVKLEERNLEMYMDVVNSLYFFFDTAAKRPDLKDAEFMGDYWYMVPTEIFEKWQNITPAERIAIDEYVTNGNNAGGIGDPHRNDGRVPVFRVYWRDCDEFDFGWVRDEFGYELFTRINHENSPYTDKDLLDFCPKEAESYTKGQVKVKRYADVLRYCDIIPGEIIGFKHEDTRDEWRDIVLDFGIDENSEHDILNHDSVHFPYKCWTWAYHEGQVLSPTDDAIDPQRFINRILSIAESQVNNSRGAGIFYDKDILDPQEGEEGMLRDMNLGKPVGVEAKRLGVQNVVGTYDMTVKDGTLGLFNIVREIKQQIQDTNGVNEQMQGTSGGAQGLVRTTEMMIQRGTLMQEPFYFCLVQILMQLFQGVATAGKHTYLKNRRKLAIIAGDEYTEVLAIAEQLMNEDFRTFVKRVASVESERQQVDQVAMSFLQAGLITKKGFAQVVGKGSMDDLFGIVRDTVREEEQAEQAQRRAEERMMPMMQEMMAQEQQQQGMAQDVESYKAGLLEKMKQDGDTKRTALREVARENRDTEANMVNMAVEKEKMDVQKQAAMAAPKKE